MFRPNPAPLRVLGRRRRGGHVMGACGRKVAARLDYALPWVFAERACGRQHWIALIGVTAHFCGMPL